MGKDLALLTIEEAMRAIASRRIEPEDILRENMLNIERLNEKLRAFITVFPKPETSRAKRRGALRGITISIKDIIHVRGYRTTAGSKILKDYKSESDATVVARLKDAGAWIIGKTNLHEFAFGMTNINPHFGTCMNPWSVDRISGGSSGGSAASVAAGMCCGSVGTDTAGSIRAPASLCGVVGYKPTYGLVSRHGVIPLSWSLDHVGFLARSVKDVAILLQATYGVDGLDGSALRVKGINFMNVKARPLKNLRIGIPKNYFLQNLQEDVKRAFEEVMSLAEGYGAVVEYVEVRNVDEINAARNLIAHAEAASYHWRFITTRFEDYGEDLKVRLSQGIVIPASAYLAAQRARRRLIDQFRPIFKRVDVLAMPTTPITAPKPGQLEVEVGEVVMDVRSALMRNTQTFNLLGVPAISLPCGLSREGLPIGLELVGDVMKDRDLISAAMAFEKVIKPIGPPPILQQA